MTKRKPNNYNLDGTFVGIPVTTICSDEWRLLKAYSRAIYVTMLLKYWRKYDNLMVDWKQTELAEESGLPLRTVQRGLKELREHEFISMEKPGGRWSTCATYRINPEFADWNTESPKGTKN